MSISKLHSPEVDAVEPVPSKSLEIPKSDEKNRPSLDQDVGRLDVLVLD